MQVGFGLLKRLIEGMQKEPGNRCGDIYPPKAAAPPTISESSEVIASCRALL